MMLDKVLRGRLISSRDERGRVNYVRSSGSNNYLGESKLQIMSWRITQLYFITHGSLTLARFWVLNRDAVYASFRQVAGGQRPVFGCVSRMKDC